jgi:hypothetical protein
LFFFHGGGGGLRCLAGSESRFPYKKNISKKNRPVQHLGPLLALSWRPGWHFAKTYPQKIELACRLFLF